LSKGGSQAKGGIPGTLGIADEPSGSVVGLIIETLVKEGAHLMTPVKLVILGSCFNIS